jgi:putative SOS response-associated peptidase YedK
MFLICSRYGKAKPPTGKDRRFCISDTARVFVSERGLGKLVDPMVRWLNTEIGRTNYAWHSGGSGAGRDRIALYFRQPADVMSFQRAFPMLELADGTVGNVYTSPDLPFGRQFEDDPVCNLYTQTRAQEAMRQLFAGMTFSDRAGNLEPGKVYPDQMAPIVRHGEGGLELVKARWGMPSPPFVLKTQRDPGVTNVRNLASPHWRRWLGPAHRCLVPFSAFAEPIKGGNQWFTVAHDKPAFFAGIEVRDWVSVRKVKDGETTDDLFAFLTCPPNSEVAEVHPKAMPTILTDPMDWETWLTAPAELASSLQRPLPDGSLLLVEGQS